MQWSAKDWDGETHLGRKARFQSWNVKFLICGHRVEMSSWPLDIQIWIFWERPCLSGR